MSCLCLAIISARSFRLRVFSISMILPSPPFILFFLSSLYLATRLPCPPPPYICVSVSFLCYSCGSSCFFKSYCQLTCLQGLNNFSKAKFKKTVSSYLMTSSESFIGPLSKPTTQVGLKLYFSKTFTSLITLNFFCL